MNTAPILQNKWPANMPPPVQAADTRHAYRAMSLLANMEFQDGDKHPPILPVVHALDVIRWATGEQL